MAQKKKTSAESAQEGRTRLERPFISRIHRTRSRATPSAALSALGASFTELPRARGLTPRLNSCQRFTPQTTRSPIRPQAQLPTPNAAPQRGRGRRWKHEQDFEAPCEHPQPATRVQFAAGAILQHSATPTPLFEHEHEDDCEVPGEGSSPDCFTRYTPNDRSDPPVGILSTSSRERIDSRSRTV
jgi:hypothetical protein